MSYMKEQNIALEKELNKMETDNLPNAEFKTLVIGYSMNSGEEQMNSVRT